MAVLYYAHAWAHEKSCWYCGNLICSYSISSNSNKWHLLLHKQLTTLDHLSLAYYIGTFSNMTSYQKTDILRYIMLPSECFPSMFAMQFPYIPVMNILVIWALIQLVLPPCHSYGGVEGTNISICTVEIWRSEGCSNCWLLILNILNILCSFP